MITYNFTSNIFSVYNNLLNLYVRVLQGYCVVKKQVKTVVSKISHVKLISVSEKLSECLNIFKIVYVIKQNKFHSFKCGRINVWCIRYLKEFSIWIVLLKVLFPPEYFVINLGW